MADGLTFTWSAEALAEIDAAMDRIKHGTQRVAAVRRAFWAFFTVPPLGISLAVCTSVMP